MKNPFDLIRTETEKILLQEKVILYPTDTIWGMGCIMNSEAAVTRMFEIKQRSKEKSFILLVSDTEMLKMYLADLHPRIETLLHYHTKPLTLVGLASELVPTYIQAHDHTVAIRVVRDSFCQSLIEHLGVPITSTSANISGQTFPKSYFEIDEMIKSQVDYIVPYRQDETFNARPSVMAKYDRKGNLEFLRN